jgi:tetratricopeptide (TPR) repeat protein
MDVYTYVRAKLGQALELMLIGQAQEAQHGFEEAEAMLLDALATKQEDPWIHLVLARLLETRQEYDRAEIHYVEAQRLKPSDDAARFGLLAVATKRTLEAARTWERLQSTDLRQSSAPEQTAEATEDPHRSDTPLEDLDNLFDLMRWTLDQGHRLTMGDLTEHQLRAVGADLEASLWFARYLADQRLSDQARLFYRNALKLAPDDLEVIRECAAAEIALEQNDRALLEMAAAWCEARTGFEDKADLLFRRALDHAPLHTAILQHYVRYLVERQRSAEANEWLLQLAEIDSPAARALCHNNHPEPKADIQAHITYARLLRRVGALDEAEHALEQALEHNPNQSDLLISYVDLLVDVGKASRAEEVLLRGIEQGEASAEIEWRYGKLLVARGRHRQAKNYFARAAELSEDPRIHKSYDEITYHLERIEQAESKWALAVRTASTNPAKAQALLTEALAVYSDHFPAIVRNGNHHGALGKVEKPAVPPTQGVSSP